MMKVPEQRNRSVTIVVTVTVGAFLLGAFVVPRLIHADVTAGEHAAIEALITISGAETGYRQRYPEIGFAPRLATLASVGRHCEPSPEQACLVERDLARNDGRTFRGYYFADASGSEMPRTSYFIAAVPERYGRTGKRAFCLVERGIPRFYDFGRDVRPQEITREQCLRDFKPLP